MDTSETVPEYDPRPVIIHICRTLGHQDTFYKINTIGNYLVPAWKTASQVEVVLEANLPDTTSTNGIDIVVTECQIRGGPGALQPAPNMRFGNHLIDLSQVYVRSISNNRTFYPPQESAIPIALSVFPCPNEHISKLVNKVSAAIVNMAGLGNSPHKDRFLGTFSVVEPSADVLRPRDFSGAADINQLYMTGNIAAFAWLCDENLENGVIPIPAGICQEARLRIATLEEIAQHAEMNAQNDDDDDDEDMPDALPDNPTPDDEAEWNRRRLENIVRKERPILCWYAVPSDHLLAWGMRGVSKRERLKNNIIAQEVTVQNTDPQSDEYMRVRIPYYLVPDVTYISLCEHARHTFFGKYAKTDLHQLALRFTPLYNGDDAPLFGTHGAKSEVRLSYVGWPEMTHERIRLLYPQLPPDNISLTAYLNNALEETREIVMERSAARSRLNTFS